MFDVDENGNMSYAPETGSGNSVVPPAGSLFGVPAQPEEDFPEESLADGASVPEVPEAPPADTDMEVTGSGNGVQLPPVIGSVDGFSVTTSGDVYIYPDGPDAEPLAEMRSAYSATVLGLPNGTSLSYLEGVVAGYPSWYKYMAFKSDTNYSQSMVLWVAPQGEKSSSQNRMDFTDVDCIEVAYVRSGSSYTYEYRSSHYDSYQVAYDPAVFLYTNIVDGYAEFDAQHPLPVAGILFLVFVVIVLLCIFRGGGRH